MALSEDVLASQEPQAFVTENEDDRVIQIVVYINLFCEEIGNGTVN